MKHHMLIVASLLSTMFSPVMAIASPDDDLATARNSYRRYREDLYRCLHSRHESTEALMAETEPTDVHGYLAQGRHHGAEVARRCPESEASPPPPPQPPGVPADDTARDADDDEQDAADDEADMASSPSPEPRVPSPADQSDPGRVSAIAPMILGGNAGLMSRSGPPPASVGYLDGPPAGTPGSGRLVAITNRAEFSGGVVCDLLHLEIDGREVVTVSGGRPVGAEREGGGLVSGIPYRGTARIMLPPGTEHTVVPTCYVRTGDVYVSGAARARYAVSNGVAVRILANGRLYPYRRNSGLVLYAGVPEMAIDRWGVPYAVP